jgi:hypothetical protein
MFWISPDTVLCVSHAYLVKRLRKNLAAIFLPFVTFSELNPIIRHIDVMQPADQGGMFSSVSLEYRDLVRTRWTFMFSVAAHHLICSPELLGNRR